MSILSDPASTYSGRRPRLTPWATLRAYVSKPGCGPSDVDSQTYIVPNRVCAQSDIAPSGSYVFCDTVMDVRMVNDPRYIVHFDLALQDIPTMSIVIDWEDLFGTGGIRRGSDPNSHSLDKPCSIELICLPLPKFAGLVEFQVNGGIKIRAAAVRGTWATMIPSHPLPCCSTRSSTDLDGWSIRCLRPHRWKAGNVVDLYLPMPIGRVHAHENVEADPGKVALMRGPIVYCLEAAGYPDVDIFELSRCEKRIT